MIVNKGCACLKNKVLEVEMNFENLMSNCFIENTYNIQDNLSFKVINDQIKVELYQPCRRSKKNANTTSKRVIEILSIPKPFKDVNQLHTVNVKQESNNIIGKPDSAHPSPQIAEVKKELKPP